MIEIASDSTGNGVFQKDIAQKQGISNKYLDYIISALKASNLICNVKGKKSGYVLTKAPSEISIFDIHNAFENGICVIDCISMNYKCEKDGYCNAQNFWKGLNEIIFNYFKNNSLQDIMNNSSILEK